MDDSNGDYQDSHSPYNFSWVLDNKLAAMAWPSTKANLNYLYQIGIRHMVTLSPEKMPPYTESDLEWTLIPIEEFEPPTLNDIITFIDICERYLAKNEAVGVHCRMGLGRTGVMCACFLVRFCGLTPQAAISKLRMARPWSVETYGQERSVFHYYDHLLQLPQCT